MTTPIIHPINEKKPELPCWLFLPNAKHGWFRLSGGLPVDISGCSFTHWSPDSPLPPEVTPEQPDRTSGGPLRPLPGTTFDVPPASSPSPAAMEAAKEFLDLVTGLEVKAQGTSADTFHINRLTINGDFTTQLASIIDRKFPRQEDGARLDAVLSGNPHGLAVVGLSVENWKYNHIVANRPALDSILRAALQDSREGKSK